MQKNYRIDLRNYKIKALPNGMTRPQREQKINCVDYDVRRVISMVILHPNQAHKGFKFYTVAKIAEKIKNAKEDFVILNEADYNTVKACFDNFSGFAPDDAEMVGRIYEAEVIQD